MKAKYIKRYKNRGQVLKHHYYFRFSRYWLNRFKCKQKAEKDKTIKLENYL